ncbi:hypothetical protein [Salana multivorans]
MPDHDRLWAFVRTLPTQDGEVTGRSILLVANFSSEDLGVDLPASLGDGLTTRLYAAFDAWYHRQSDDVAHPVVIASHAFAREPEPGGHLWLRPWESVAWLV